jgi:hypothetical protein
MAMIVFLDFSYSKNQFSVQEHSIVCYSLVNVQGCLADCFFKRGVSFSFIYMLLKHTNNIIAHETVLSMYKGGRQHYFLGCLQFI